MGNRSIDIRITGKDLFIYYHKKLAEGHDGIIVNACTNKRILSKRTGLDEGLLMRIFTRKGLCYYENEDTIILKLHTRVIEKGKQSMVRKGKGGMERFVEKYVIKGRDSY
jgi:hypothetical protein